MSLIKNTIDIECLIQSLQNLIDAKNKHDKERDAYDGYSWGYFGHSLVKDMEDAAEEFGNRLAEIIDKRVDEKLKELNVE